MKPWIVNTRIALGGMWAFFLSVGVVRGLTVLEKHFTSYYETNTAGISLMSSLLLLGYLIGGTSAGVVIPNFGVKYPTIISGLTCIAGCCIIASTLHLKCLPIAYVIVILMLGIPQGLCINTTMASSRFNVMYEYVGLVMTLMGGGVSLAALILPKLYKEMFNYAFDHQPEVHYQAKNQTNIGLTLDTFPYFEQKMAERICHQNSESIYKSFEKQHQALLKSQELPSYTTINCSSAYTGQFVPKYENEFARIVPDCETESENMNSALNSYYQNEIARIQNATPAFLITDMKRTILFENNYAEDNFTNLQYPLMVMWYFIGATMAMLVFAGILILEKPSLKELEKLKKGAKKEPEPVENDTSESEVDRTILLMNQTAEERNSPKSGTKTKLSPSKEDYEEGASNHSIDLNDTRRLLDIPKQRQRSNTSQNQPRNRKLSNLMESMNLTLPKDYGNTLEMTKNTVGNNSLQEVQGIFSWKLITQHSFVLHMLAQMLFFSGYFCILPYLDGLLAYFGMPEVERPDFILIMGVVEIFSRLWHAFYLVDRFNKIKLIAFTYFGDGVGLMLCLLGYFWRPYWKVFMILSFVIGGYFNAGFGGLVMACLCEITDVDYFSVGVSMQSVSIGIGESLGPIIGGAVNSGQFEGELGYLVAVLVGGILMMAGGLIAGCMHFAFQREQRLKRKQENGGLTVSEDRQ